MRPITYTWNKITSGRQAIMYIRTFYPSIQQRSPLEILNIAHLYIADATGSFWNSVRPPGWQVVPVSIPLLICWQYCIQRGFHGIATLWLREVWHHGGKTSCHPKFSFPKLRDKIKVREPGYKAIGFYEDSLATPLICVCLHNYSNYFETWGRYLFNNTFRSFKDLR